MSLWLVAIWYSCQITLVAAVSHVKSQASCAKTWNVCWAILICQKAWALSFVPRVLARRKKTCNMTLTICLISGRPSKNKTKNIRHHASSIKKQVSLPVLSVTICVMISLRFGLITKTLILKQQALLMQWCQNKPKSYANIPIMNQCFRALISKNKSKRPISVRCVYHQVAQSSSTKQKPWSLSISTQLSRLKVQTLLRLLIIPT